MSGNAAGNDFHLLLTDILMPHGMTGVQLAETLRAQQPGLKIVFMSGYSGAAVANFNAAGASQPRLIRKPFLSNDLVLRLLRIDGHGIKEKVVKQDEENCGSGVRRESASKVRSGL